MGDWGEVKSATLGAVGWPLGETAGCGETISRAIERINGSYEKKIKKVPAIEFGKRRFPNEEAHCAEGGFVVRNERPPWLPTPPKSPKTAPKNKRRDDTPWIVAHSIHVGHPAGGKEMQMACRSPEKSATN